MTFTSGRFDDSIGAPVPNGAYYTVAGWYKNTGTSVGGAIDTGLENIYQIQLTPNVSAVQPILAVTPEVDKPIDGQNVTITTGAGDDGRWIAYGA